MAQLTVADERYVFRSQTRNRLFMLLGVGVVLFILGLVLDMRGGGAHGEAHAMVNSSELVASTAAPAPDQEHAAAEAEEHHGSAHWLKRLYTTLWMNNIFFLGIGIIGLFFVAIQYAAQAGWSAGFLRVPLVMGNWIPYAGILMIVLYFLSAHDLFHWSHEGLYGEYLDDGVTKNPTYDYLIDKKGTYFFFPVELGTFPVFFIFRMVLFFAMWFWFLIMIRKNMLAEDMENTTAYWYKNRTISALFLIFFALSSSIAAWDWVMSIDTHWFSTMFGWYVFASWWVTGLAVITLVVVFLKDAGYLKIVDANHLHDLGKFIFAFSIFWTYIWFSQFMLIYYANIPEETVYFLERLNTSPYSWIFYANLILNFVLPFLLFMTRDSKRQMSMLKVVCPIVILGHWFDFYNMVTPGVMKEEGGVGFMEIGIAIIFLAAFLLVTMSGLAKIPLIGKNHPMLQESLNHHI